MLLPHRSTLALRCSVATLVALAALAPLGCQTDRSSSTGAMPARHDTSTSMPAATSDGEFAATMAMHHTGAIEMARVEAQSGARADVRALATKIVDAQSAEKPKLEAIARETGHAGMQPDPMMEKHSMMDMQELKAARGGEVDRVFLTHMIDHHENGVKMAKAAMPNLRRDDLRRMATMMIDDQTREVSQMRAMLNQ